MRTAITISYILLAALGVVVIMNYLAIQKLTPQAPANPPAQNNTESSSRKTSGSFGDMVDAVQRGAKELEIKATF